MDMLKELEEMFQLVRDFLLTEGRSRMEEHGRNVQGDITKGFDIGAENILIDYCKKKKLPVELLTEEQGLVKIAEKPEYTLVIDPVDGSTNYARGLENVAFSVAVLPHGGLMPENIEYALTGNIFTGTVFKAEKDKGAFCNDSKIMTSKMTDLSGSLMYVIFDSRTSKDAAPILESVYRARGLGAATLELAYVANGSCEATLTFQESPPENFVAAYLIIKEAGGVFTDIKGNALPELSMEKGYKFLAAGNKQIHEQIIELLK